MLTRTNKLGNPEKFFNDAMMETPTASRSIYDSLASGVATPLVALNELDDEFAKKPEGRAIASTLQAINLERQAPNLGWGQWFADEGASMLGYSLNPLTWVFGEAGGLITKGAGNLVGKGLSRVLPDAASIFMRKPLSEVLAKPVSRYLPSMIGKEGAEKPLSGALLSEKTLETFGTFAGAGVPQGIVDNYNLDTGHIAWGGVAREATEMGAFGLAIGSIPFAYGVLRGKVNRTLGKNPNDIVDMATLDKALKGKLITPEEHQWYSDYLEHLKNPADVKKTKQLQERGSRIIKENGQLVNTVSNEAILDILSPDDVTNLHGVIADQLASAHLPMEQRLALSDYIIHNRMDYLRKDPKSLDGLRGYLDFINQKLGVKKPKLLEADGILDKHLTHGVKENMPFSQKELFKMMKQSGFEASHTQHLPVTIPENMVRRIKILDKISKLKEKIKAEQKKLNKTGLKKKPNRQTAKRIAELETNLPKILTPKEELEHLRKTLIGEKGLPQDYERTAAYHRLVDLSHVWHNARTLLDRVHLEAEYNRQEAFRDISHQLLKAATLSKPENVVDYLKRRIKGNIYKVEPIEKLNAEVQEQTKMPSDAEAITKEQEHQTKNTKAEDAKKELVQVTEKFNEFKSSENIFKNLISCVLGGLGA